MLSDFQKTAKPLPSPTAVLPGIVDYADFSRHYELHHYEPPEDLRPFVVSIWIQRKKVASSNVRPVEIQTGPNAFLFINQHEAFIHGIHSGAFKYNPTIGIHAGVKFRPGGFYAFWGRPMSELAERTFAAEAIFPEIDEKLRSNLSSMEDLDIVHVIEGALRTKHPVLDRRAQEATRIVDLIREDASLYCVRDITEASHRSERSLQLLFQEYIGVPLKWVLMRKRLISALIEANAHTKKWADIAADLGYSSQSHLTRDLKHATGMSPTICQKVR